MVQGFELESFGLNTFIWKISGIFPEIVPKYSGNIPKRYFPEKKIATLVAVQLKEHIVLVPVVK
jgi:hypothetical protein